MDSRQHLGSLDYVVLVFSLIVPIMIGIKFGVTRNHENATSEYILAGKSASKFAVIMSISVTCVSAVTLLGLPAEVYRFGMHRSIQCFSIAIGMLFASRIFLPVYYNCNVSSIYEFLELRFGKYTRYGISAIFIIQMELYMTVVLTGPVLALNAVTDISFEVAAIICGAVCTFYCFLGGLKAILWADVFQALLMFLSLIIVFVVGINEVGGLKNLWLRAEATNRLDIFNFHFDFTSRYNFWNCFARGFVFGLGFYGASQTEVQRSLTMSNCKKSQAALQWSTIPVFLLTFLSSCFGIVLYSIFYLCDPVKNQEETGITKYDQLLPYFLVTRLNILPGITGLCISGIFSGSLSTISSALNSIATVTLIDFIKPLYSNNLNQSKELLLAKIMTVVYGIICICLTFITSSVDSLFQLGDTFVSLAEGPVLAVFIIGVLTRRSSDKCCVFGFIVGVSLTSWLGISSLMTSRNDPQLPLNTSGCTKLVSLNATSNVICGNWTSCSSPEVASSSDSFVLYRISFMWFPLLGFFFTLATILIFSFLPGMNQNAILLDPRFLSPVVGNWKKYIPIKKEVKQEDTAMEYM